MVSEVNGRICGEFGGADGRYVWLAGPSGQYAQRGSIEPPAGPRSVAVGSLGRRSEHGERGVQAVLAAPVGLVVGFGRDESDQLVQVVLGGRKGSAVGVGAHGEHQPFAVGVQQLQLAQRRGRLVADDDLVDGAGEGELRRRRS